MARVDVSRNAVLRKGAGFGQEFVSGVTMTNGNNTFSCTAMAIPSIRRMLTQSVIESLGTTGILWQFVGGIAYADFTFEVPAAYMPNTAFGFVGSVTVRSVGHNMWPGSLNLNSADGNYIVTARIVRLSGDGNQADNSIYQIAVEYGY